jgi:RNA polymerase sigma factor (sigma-70 family)
VVLGTQSDSRLVELARAGSEPAFEAIVERYRGPLRRYCRHMAPQSRIDDVVQSAFLSTYRALTTDSRDLNLRPWLFRVTHNAALDALRHEARATEQLDDSYDGVERPEIALERRESLRTLLTELGHLPERQRMALVLRELEGRSYDEIAQELGVGVGAVRQLLNRARNRLRAAASAVLPLPLLLLLSRAGSHRAGAVDRIAELTSSTAAAGGIAKVGAVVATTGAMGAAALSVGGGEPPVIAGESHGAPTMPGEASHDDPAAAGGHDGEFQRTRPGQRRDAGLAAASPATDDDDRRAGSDPPGGDEETDVPPASGGPQDDDGGPADDDGGLADDGGPADDGGGAGEELGSANDDHEAAPALPGTGSALAGGTTAGEDAGVELAPDDSASHDSDDDPTADGADDDAGQLGS